jgi:hypothetical protein
MVVTIDPSSSRRRKHKSNTRYGRLGIANPSTREAFSLSGSRVKIARPKQEAAYSFKDKANQNKLRIERTHLVIISCYIWWIPQVKKQEKLANSPSSLPTSALPKMNE